MPAQKRLSMTLHEEEEEEEQYHEDDFEEDQLLLLARRSKKICSDQVDEDTDDDDDDDDDDDEEEEEDKAEDSEESPSSSDAKPEFVFVQLPEIHKDVQCPICLGIIKKTRTVMECLHRFCRECIDKSMRMGNNECPACRTHCASRRSLRDDPNYDALIALLYPDINKYEEEELAFHEEDHARNKQIQASIAQILHRQSEALVKRRTPGKDTQDSYMTRTQRNSYLRRRSSRGSELQGSEDNEDSHENNTTGRRDESSNDERRTEVRPRRRRRRAPVTNNRSSPVVAANSHSECGTENDVEGSRGISPGLASEILAWGRGGTRSHTRHGNAGGWSSRNTRLSKLVDYLRNLEENYDEELDVHVVLISLDKHSMPSLQQPHLCCRPTLSVKGLCEYVAGQIPLNANEVELLALSKDDKMALSCSKSTTDLVSLAISAGKDDMQVVGAEETLATVKANFTFTSSRDSLILLYRRKGGN